MVVCLVIVSQIEKFFCLMLTERSAKCGSELIIVVIPFTCILYTLIVRVPKVLPTLANDRYLAQVHSNYCWINNVFFVGFFSCCLSNLLKKIQCKLKASATIFGAFSSNWTQPILTRWNDRTLFRFKVFFKVVLQFKKTLWNERL